MNETPSENSMILTRREVLQTAASWALLLPMLAAGAAPPAPVPPGVWTTAGKAKEFLKDKPKHVVLPGGVVLYVTRTSPAHLEAVSAKCTHRGCEIGWAAADHQFQCPCHGAAFAADGKNLHGTRREPDEHLPNLAVVPIRQKGTWVQVNLAAVPSDDLKPMPDA